MNFTLLHSRGGDYMVALQNIAYLRNDENGQTKVGMIGGIRFSSSAAWKTSSLK